MTAAALSGCAQTGSTIKVEATDTDEQVIYKAAHLVPTENQMAALQNEFIAFVHFGPNTFTRMEWGNGMEDPKIFNPSHIDTDQWCEALRDAGMKMVILTAKHHDGFVLWQSRYTTHGIMSSDYEGGKADIMKDLSASCQKYGLKLGVYLSPADLFQIESPDGLYGNLSPYTMRTIPREVEGRPFKCQKKFKFELDDYNEYFLSQLYELLTEYGPIHEVWFDGAHPKTKGGQKYNYAAWRELIRSLAPQATIFGREDIRWCGNEAGHTRDSEWNTLAVYDEDPRTADVFRDLYGDLGTKEVILGKERPYYLHYQPAETNTSIRDGWFYRDDEFQKTRTADDVFDIYERSVGGNSIFLLNIPPNREGLFSPRDVEVLKETGRRIHATYDTDLFAGAKVRKTPEEISITLREPVALNRIALREDIKRSGERVENFAVDALVDGTWQEIATATNIGYQRILRFPTLNASEFRIRILSSRLKPEILSIKGHYYDEPSKAENQTISALDKTAWSVVKSESGLVIDLGREENISAFSYTPSAGKAIVEGSLSVSKDGKVWTSAADFKFGNLVNDPSLRFFHLDAPVSARYLRLLSGSESQAIDRLEEMDIY